MTKVIDLYAGPGAGKSTLAAAVFAFGKAEGESIELTREYVKDWAYRKQPVGVWDEPYLFAKQLRQESALYGAVDIIVTDSPLGLPAVFEAFYEPSVMTMFNLWQDILERQEAAGIVHIPLFVKRRHPFNPEGRYHNEEQCLKLDALVKQLIGPMPEVQSVEDVWKYL